MPSGTIIMPSGTIIMPSGTIWPEFLPKLARFAPGFPRRPGRRPARILRGSDLAGSVSAGDPVAPRGGATGGSRGESSQLR